VDFRGAQILTGNEEGSFGWITVNYLLETLVEVRAGGAGSGGEPCTCPCVSCSQVSLFPEEGQMSF